MSTPQGCCSFPAQGPACEGRILQRVQQDQVKIPLQNSLETIVKQEQIGLVMLQDCSGRASPIGMDSYWDPGTGRGKPGRLVAAEGAPFRPGCLVISAAKAALPAGPILFLTDQDQGGSSARDSTLVAASQDGRTESASQGSLCQDRSHRRLAAPT